MTQRVCLIEGRPPAHVELADSTVHQLQLAGLVDVATTGVTGRWLLSARRLVGVVSVSGIEVRIRPKIDVARLVFLLLYAADPKGWRDEDVEVARADDLPEALARAFLARTDKVLQRGLLQGYHSVEDTLPVLRGRLREGEQLKRRPGVPLPLEVVYDEWTVDIVENRVLRAAATALLRLPLGDAVLRARLTQLVRGPLAAVADRPVREVVGDLRLTRLNERYGPALAVAQIVLRAGSFELAQGNVPAQGFLFNLATVFEDFLCSALGEHLRGRGFGSERQHRMHLDEGGHVDMAADLVVFDGPTVRAVVDAKYKAEKPAGYPNADVYQLLAYCTALGLPSGHLVYAKGEEEPACYDVVRGGPRVLAWALDLSAPPGALLLQVDYLADAIVSAGDPTSLDSVA